MMSSVRMCEFDLSVVICVPLVERGTLVHNHEPDAPRTTVNGSVSIVVRFWVVEILTRDNRRESSNSLRIVLTMQNASTEFAAVGNAGI
jgi:hypothetical protein